MALLLSRPEYERWLYAITGTYPSVHSSTLRFYTTSATTGVVAGAIFFHNKHHHVPAPGLSFTQPNLPLLIEEVERDLPAKD